MKFDPLQFAAVKNGFHQYAWKKPDGEEVDILVRVYLEEDISKAVEWITEFVKTEPQLRSAAAERIYPDDAWWLDEECGIKSAAELLSALRWTILDVQSNDDSVYGRLVYAGPDEFQTLSAKHVLLIAISDDGDWDVNFESYDEE